MQNIFDSFALSELSTLVEFPRTLDQNGIHRLQAIQPMQSLHPEGYLAFRINQKPEDGVK
jgi:hypothetical protein